MKRLVRVEARRMLRRRVSIAMFGLAVLGIVIGSTVVFFKSSTDVEAATARARVQAEADYRECLRVAEQEGFKEECGELDVSGIVADPRYHMSGFLGVAKASSAPMIVLALLLGASFVGAEWHHRTMTNTLTWEPRRGRLLLAKALACAGVIFVAVVALQAFLGGALVPAAVAHGDFAGTEWPWMRSVTAAVLRSAATAAISSVIGLSIASLGRNTVAALGVAFGYFAVLEGIIRGAKPEWARWLVGENAAVFVSGEPLAFPGSRGTISAGILLGIYACAAFAAAAVAFRARDVG